MKSNIFSAAVLLFLLAGVGPLQAEDSLDALMQRMRSDHAVRIAYREIRTMALLERPWQSIGFMYSLPPDTMLKVQLEPERLLMAIDGDDLYYFDPGNDVRQQGTLDEDNPMSLSVAVFKALMMADRALLEKMYRVDFSGGSEQWLLRLRAKSDPDSGFAIEISGLPGRQARRIVVEQGDGERSEFELWQDAEGGAVEAQAQRLFRELRASE